MDDDELNLPCPNCGYFLRGLPGDSIRCPECFVTSSRAELLLHAQASRARRCSSISRVEHAASMCALAIAFPVVVVCLIILSPNLFAPMMPITLACSGVVFGVGLVLYIHESNDATGRMKRLARYHVYAVPSILVNMILLSVVPLLVAGAARNGMVGFLVFVALLVGVLVRNPMRWLNTRARAALGIATHVGQSGE